MLLQNIFFIFIWFISNQINITNGWRQWTWNNKINPGPRRGHTMNLYKTNVIIFGGRADDKMVLHTPKTYEIEEINGTLQFKTYTEKPVRNSCPYNAKSGDVCEEIPLEQNIVIGTYFNDIWSYDINCSRYADVGCVDTGWIQLEPGAIDGGCMNVYGAEVCSHPSERWNHGAQVVDNDIMFIYGGYSQRCADYCDDMWSFNFNTNEWTEIAEIGNTIPGPGKRWKFSTATDNKNIYMFGGFRLWHGFSAQNSEENNWEDVFIYPLGGYLDDLWIYDPVNNNWEKPERVKECYLTGNPTWDQRNEVKCTVVWPSPRAGHASVLYDNCLYIHGGYRTFFPYPSTTGPGSGRGILSTSGAGFSPFPSHPYYLDDFWKFNLTSGIWIQIIPTSGDKPDPRHDHVLVEADGVFVLFGGYKSNYYYDDTWQYNISANEWVKQENFVHALYPISCTDDLEDRKDPFSGTYREWKQPPGYTNIDDKNNFSPELHYGTLKFSVWAQPTRDNFLANINNDHLFILQARRQAPGWDGCRDRYDNRTDLPNQLQWIHPSQRGGHQAVYHKDLKIMLIYGGYGPSNEYAYRADFTLPGQTLNDMWQYNLKNCIKNCSLHGNCNYGKCYCDDGYYGIDCSNITCPGTSCYYSRKTKKETCNHCCFSGYEHLEDDDTYIPNIQKLPCNLTDPNMRFFSNGICDGFGKCICRPNFIGDDCSIRDCKYNCSNHGYCSVEFPNSRCLCDEGYIGKYCNEKICLNNCSYPNGQCINGSCWCSMLYESYNSSLEYFPYMGEDCSIMIPFAYAVRIQWSIIIFILVFLLFIIIFA